MAAIVGPGGPSTATQFAIDGPGGPVVAGDHLRRDRPTPKSWSQIDSKTNKRIFLSKVERRQQYIDMMVGGDADLKPLVTSCLEDVPKLRPLMADISARLKKMKEACTKKTIHDGMDPISSLGMSKQASLSKII